ncbi:MAG: ParB/RepB/Spo0J family partition protein [Bacteroidetes bacterium]|nr:ParB/RepB/Spo0J family partition protein [Bacteroidota bacterium]
MSSNKKNVLGRGLSALLENSGTDITSSLPADKAAQNVGNVANIRIEHIEANPFQPRTEFEKEALLELAQSIKELGIIQPLTVRKLGYDKFQIISGERRFRASQLAGLTEVPAYIRIANDQAMLEMALVENIQRQDLNPIEVAVSYKRLIDECQLTQEELGERVGKNRSTTANYLRLLKLPAQIQASLKAQEITMGHARALLAIDDEDVLMYVYRKIVPEGLSVRTVEEMARQSAEEPAVNAPSKKKEDNLSFDEQKLKEDLSQLFSAKVKVVKNTKGKGSIVIPFKSEKDLQRIKELLDL